MHPSNLRGSRGPSKLTGITPLAPSLKTRKEDWDIEQCLVFPAVFLCSKQQCLSCACAPISQRRPQASTGGVFSRLWQLGVSNSGRRSGLGSNTVKATFNTPCELLGDYQLVKEAGECCTTVGSINPPGEGVENSLSTGVTCISQKYGLILYNVRKIL